MGRFLCGPSWFWAELSCTPYYHLGKAVPHSDGVCEESLVKVLAYKNVIESVFNSSVLNRMG